MPNGRDHRRGQNSVRKPPHPHVQDEAERGERRDERRPAITHERQGQPLHRGQTRRHSDVVQHLERETRNDCDDEEAPRPGRGPAWRRPDSARSRTDRAPSATSTPRNPCSSASTEKTKSLWATGRNPYAALGALPEPLARQAAGPDRDLGLNLLIAGAARVLRRIEERLDALLLVVLQPVLPDRPARAARRRARRSTSQRIAQAGEVGDAEEHRQQRRGRAEVRLLRDEQERHGDDQRRPTTSSPIERRAAAAARRRTSRARARARCARTPTAAG